MAFPSAYPLRGQFPVNRKERRSSEKTEADECPLTNLNKKIHIHQVLSLRYRVTP